MIDPFPLSAYELPRWLVGPMVSACRMVNTAVDIAFYDVPDLVRELAAENVAVATMPTDEKLPSRVLDLGAASNPEGALLLIDTTTPPYVHRFTNVDEYLNSEHHETKQVAIAAVTGVGSSAYGSAAFGWQVSRALGRPVLAIVPGYGVADMIQQALGGWFAFGLHDYLGIKPAVQNVLADIAPETAKIGRALPRTIPGHAQEPVFEHGSGSSDVLHALLSDERMNLRTLIGHSKGALVVKNAIRSLPALADRGLTVVTLGCPIAKEYQSVRYFQYLGCFDMLGQLNAWGNDDYAPQPSMHTTNPYQVLPLAVERLLQEALTADQGATPKAVR